MINLIIPMYNSEETIARALGSVVAQTRKNKVLTTIVDDCSTDNSAKIVKKFKDIIPIKYIKNEVNHKKPGLVRQVGIDASVCPYVMFMDSDDMLTPNAVEVLSRAVLQKDYDYVNSAFYQDNRADEYNIIKSNQITWLHGNIYKRQFLVDNNIRFDDKYNEDGSFNMKCYWLAKNKGRINQPLYFWMDNKESITRSDDKFMLKIAYDFICTYTDATRFCIERMDRENLDLEFIKGCANKMAQFFQFLDACIFYNDEVEDRVVEKVQEYVNLCKEYNMIDKNFLEFVNYYFNIFDIFTTIYRQKLLIDYYEYFNIDYKGMISCK